MNTFEALNTENTYLPILKDPVLSPLILYSSHTQLFFFKEIIVVEPF